MSESTPHLHAVGTAVLEPEPEVASGVTPPRREGGSSRSLADVLVELGFVDRDRVQRAIEEARCAGSPPERVLLEQRAITAEELSHAIASATASIISTSGCSRSTWRR